MKYLKNNQFKSIIIYLKNNKIRSIPSTNFTMMNNRVT